jgi:hypothetical protein
MIGLCISKEKLLFFAYSSLSLNLEIQKFDCVTNNSQIYTRIVLVTLPRRLHLHIQISLLTPERNLHSTSIKHNLHDLPIPNLPKSLTLNPLPNTHRTALTLHSVMPMINISLLWKFKPPHSDSRKPANPKKNLASILNHSNGPFVFYGLV